jgi:hypothetical protein
MHLHGCCDRLANVQDDFRQRKGIIDEAFARCEAMPIFPSRDDRQQAPSIM